MSMLFPGQAPKKKQLTIELVPGTSWFKNARSILTKTEWDRVRKRAYQKAGHHCEVCNDQGPKWPVECHEIWTFRDSDSVQKLDGLQALCPNCHMVKHYGFAQMRGLEQVAFEHLCKVNDWSKYTATQYVRESFILWKKRSAKSWVVDVSHLSEYGIDPYDLSSRATQKSSSFKKSATKSEDDEYNPTQFEHDILE